MYTLVLLRHGQTTYNKEKIFCGWSDADLTEQGVQEATMAGENLKKAGHTLDAAFCSVLTRAIKTLGITLDGMGIENLPTNYSWRLNERHYGSLQGQKHADVAKTCSVEQVQKWRRSFSERPPQLGIDDPRNPCNDAKYCDIDRNDLPSGESLEDTIKRVLPYWEKEIAPQIKNGKKIIVSASGNSLRGLIKHIDGISDDDVVGLEIKTGTPLVYELDKNLSPLNRYYLLKDGIKESIS